MPVMARKLRVEYPGAIIGPESLSSIVRLNRLFVAGSNI